MFINNVVPGTLIYEATVRLDRLTEPKPPAFGSIEWWDWRTSLRDAEEAWQIAAKECPPWGWVP